MTKTISLPMTFAVHTSVPVRSLKELIAMARARPGEITYGTPGVGTTHHVLTELFALTTKVKLTHLPFGGGAPAITALAGGHIVLDVGNVSEIAPFANSGKVRALVVTTDKRAEQLPDVPTFREVGLAELEATNWAWSAPAPGRDACAHHRAAQCRDRPGPSHPGRAGEIQSAGDDGAAEHARAVRHAAAIGKRALRQGRPSGRRRR